MRDSSSRRALSLALAGTLGVGNIVGVAYGISVGGAGCLFWMLISAVFSAVIKFAESTLSADKRSDGGGGMARVIGERGKIGKGIGIIYALLCVALSLTMGTALQSKSALSATSSFIKIPPAVISVFFSFLVVITVFGGYRKIEGVTAALIPVATAIYAAICLGVIITNVDRVPSVLAAVMREAFDFKSAVGGVSVFLLSKTVKEGYARGLLSNEAGAGTSAMAESRSRSPHPAAVGLLGMCEVLFDTILLCTLTALAVLVGIPGEISGDGIEIVIEAFTPLLSSLAAPLVSALIMSFAYSTVVCWYFYGCESLSFIFGGRGRNALYIALFIGSTFGGFLLPEWLLITVSDYILFFMSAITLFTLIKSSERIRDLSEQYGLLNSKRRLKNSDVGKGGKSGCRS